MISAVIKIQTNILTSESAPLSSPGQTNVTNSWHLLWTTKLHTEIFCFY